MPCNNGSASSPAHFHSWTDSTWLPTRQPHFVRYSVTGSHCGNRRCCMASGSRRMDGRHCWLRPRAHPVLIQQHNSRQSAPSTRHSPQRMPHRAPDCCSPVHRFSPTMPATPSVPACGHCRSRRPSSSVSFCCSYTGRFTCSSWAGLPIVTGLLAGSLATSTLFGNIHGITLVFGITLLGVAIDYPIHLFSHLAPDKTPRQSITHIWPTLRLGVITTCIGYLAFARQDFPGLAQLGIFTTCGLLTAAVITRWLLPSLLVSARPPNVRGSPDYRLALVIESAAEYRPAGACHSSLSCLRC